MATIQTNNISSLSIEASFPSPPPSDTEDPKPAQNAMFKVAVLAVTIAAGGIVNLPMALPAGGGHKLLSKAYIFAVFTSFSFGMGLLLLSMVLPKVPISVAAAKKFMWVVLAMIHMALALGTALVLMV